MTDYRKLALEDLAAFCSGIIPTDVGIFPTEKFGIELANDLRLLAKKVDAVISSYGDYAESVIGLAKGDHAHFQDQLAGAIEGNATYCIESSAREREEETNSRDVDADYEAMRDRKWEAAS